VIVVDPIKKGNGDWIVAVVFISERSMKCSANIRLHTQTALSVVDSAC